MTDVELVVTARNEAVKSIDDLVKSLSEIEKKDGAIGFFRRLTQTTDELQQKQKELGEQSERVSEAQDRLSRVANNQQNIFDRQQKNIQRAVDTLSELNLKYDEYAAAASRARTPSEALTKRLQSQEATQRSLADAIQKTTNDIAQAQARVANSGGFDNRATAAIAKQEARVEKLRQAWADAARQIREARKAQDEQGAGNASRNIERLTERARKQKLEYQELSRALVEFRNEQRNLSTDRQAREFQRLNEQLQRLESRYQKTGQSIAETQVRIASASAPDPAAIRRFEVLQQSIAEAEDAVKRESRALDELQKKFTGSSVDARKLAEQQEALANASDRLKREQQELGARIDGVNQAYDRSRGRAGRLRQEMRGVSSEASRSTDIIGRLRSELLLFGAATVNVFAVARGIESVFNTATNAQRASARLAARFQGDQQAIAEEIRFVREEADRLSLNFEVLLENYTKFLSGVPEGGLSLEQVRGTFSDIAEASRAAGLGVEQVQGIFTALTQIISKDSVALEELRQQLGDRLPGAVNLAAEGLTNATGELITVEELLNRINNGQVTGDAVVAIADAIQKSFGGGLEESLRSPLAALEDYRNVLTDLRLAVARSGFLDVLVDSLRRVSEQISSAEFEDFAIALANGIGNLIELTVLLAENFEVIKGVIVAIIALKLGQSLAGGARSLVAFAEAAKGAQTGIFGVITATSRLGVIAQRTLNLLFAIPAAFTAGFAIGEALNNQFSEVRKFGATLVAIFEKSLIEIDLLFEKLKVNFNSGFLSGIRQTLEAFANLLIKVFENTFNSIGGLISTFAPSVGRKLQEGVTNAANAARSGTDSLLDSILLDDSEVDKKFAELEQRAEQAKAKVDDVITSMFSDIEESAKRADATVIDVDAVDGQVDEVRDKFEGLNFFRDGVNSGKTFSEGLLQELGNIQEALADETADTLEERLQRVADEFSKVLSDLDFFEANSQSSINDIAAEATKAIARQEALREEGRISEEAAAKKIAELRFKSEQEIAQIRSKVGELSGARGTIESLINVRQEQERINFFSQQLADQQEEINSSLDVRASQQEKINELLELGLITADEAAQRLDASFEQYLIGTREAVENARVLAEQSGNSQLTEFTNSFEGFEEVERRRLEIERINALQQQANDILDQRQQKIETLNLLSQSGQITQAQSQSQINELLTSSNSEIESLTNRAIALAQSFDDAFGQKLVENLENFKAGLAEVETEIVNAEQLNQDFASGFTNAFDEFASGAKSAKDAFRDFIGDFLRRIAQAIIQQAVFNAISGGTAGGGLGGGIAAAVNHDGGIVGQHGSLRFVDPAIFRNARRMHSGGIAGSLPGLSSDEVPTILQEGEAVIPKDSVGKMMTSNGEVKVNNINLIDAAAMVAKGLQSEPGIKTLLNVISGDSRFAAAFGGR